MSLQGLETAITVIRAEEGPEDRATTRPTKLRAANRGSLPKNLPRIEELSEPECLTFVYGACMHSIGEDISQRLDIVSARSRVNVARRPQYAYRSCYDGVAQASAPARLIPGGMPI